MSERFPVETFNLQHEHWPRQGVLQSGGTAVSGLEQVTASDGGGRLTARLRFALRTPDQIKRWAKYGARFAYKGLPLEVPACSAPRVAAVVPVSAAPHGHGDGSVFSDGAGYEISPAISATVFEAAPLRSNTLKVTFAQAVSIIGGEEFSVVHPGGVRKHEIETATLISGNTYALTISPVLREAATLSTPLDFDDPRCLMRVANPSEWNAERRLLRFADPAPAFVEYIEPQAAV